MDTWERLFERAEAVETDLEAIDAALADRRDAREQVEDVDAGRPSPGGSEDPTGPDR